MKKVVVVVMVAVFAVTGLFAAPQLEASENEAPTCYITIKGTYDGKEVNVTVSLEAPDCAEAAGKVLKATMAKK